MKSPLSFLTGLVRRRSVEPQQVLLGDDSGARDTESKTEQAPAEPDLPLQLPAAEHDESVADETAPEAAAERAIEPDVEDPLPVADELPPPIADMGSVQVIQSAPVKMRAKRRPRTTPVSVETIPAVEVVPDTAAAGKTSAPVRSVSHEAVILDIEINELRKQLTRKLQLQNAQLRKMLERFGG